MSEIQKALGRLYHEGHPDYDVIADELIARDAEIAKLEHQLGAVKELPDYWRALERAGGKECPDACRADVAMGMVICADDLSRAVFGGPDQ